MGSAQKPYTATGVSYFAGNLHNFTGMQLILQFFRKLKQANVILISDINWSILIEYMIFLI